MSTDHYLATYGTLAPGKPNHLQLANLSGCWRVGTVKGNLVNKGWGAALGFPALVLGDAGGHIEVHVFESEDLPLHWSRLDAFEGPGYKRVSCAVDMIDCTVEAWIYVESESVRT